MKSIANNTLPGQNSPSCNNVPDGIFAINQGKAIYRVKVFFDHNSGLTAEDMLKRIIRAEAEKKSA